MPFKVDLKDGSVFIYPQDQLYPDQPVFDGSDDDQVGCQGPCPQDLIFLLFYDWAHWARMLHYTKLKMVTKDKYCSLLGSFKSYKEKNVVNMAPVVILFTSI